MKPIARVFILMAVLLAVFPARAAGIDYPTKPLMLICPFSPGGSRDIIGRIFATTAEKYLGKSLVVVNKAGASGVIGIQAAIQATPDGYTLALISTSM